MIWNPIGLANKSAQHTHTHDNHDPIGMVERVQMLCVEATAQKAPTNKRRENMYATKSGK